MFCRQCGKEIIDQAVICIQCGCATDVTFSLPGRKDRLTYILLGILLGPLGIHNFYAGFSGRAVAQLLISVLSFGLLSFGVWIWAIIEVCTVRRDADGKAFV